MIKFNFFKNLGVLFYAVHVHHMFSMEVRATRGNASEFVILCITLMMSATAVETWR
jgi:hypothetical protein